MALPSLCLLLLEAILTAGLKTKEMGIAVNYSHFFKKKVFFIRHMRWQCVLAVKGELIPIVNERMVLA